MQRANPDSELSLLQAARQALRDYLTRQRMRLTPERTALLEHAFARDDHFTARQLGDTLEADGFHVSHSTLYANLQLLCDAGLLAAQRLTAASPAQYRRTPPGTLPACHQLVCNVCGRVREVRSPQLLTQVMALQYPTFKAQSALLCVYGTCSRCLKRQRRLARQTTPPPAKTTKKKKK